MWEEAPWSAAMNDKGMRHEFWFVQISSESWFIRRPGDTETYASCWTIKAWRVETTLKGFEGLNYSLSNCERQRLSTATTMFCLIYELLQLIIPNISHYPQVAWRLLVLMAFGFRFTPFFSCFSILHIFLQIFTAIRSSF